jgi:hypothetical protein
VAEPPEPVAEPVVEPPELLVALEDVVLELVELVELVEPVELVEELVVSPSALACRGDTPTPAAGSSGSVTSM